MQQDPVLKNDHKFYEMTREEQMIMWWKKITRAYQIDADKWFGNTDQSKFFWFYF